MRDHGIVVVVIIIVGEVDAWIARPPVIDMSDDVSETVRDPDSQELGTQRLEEFNDWPDRQPDAGQIGHLLEGDLAEQDLISGVITEEEEEQRPCPVQPA